ncbi:hypothetical protein K7432_003028 [Basidiobolus ranarum]|uniref:Uncharacterized protein n=1 Tax=Basidiobolus ranarum TaxID=34480 RepID=A0ABR2X0J5_9FUNG
MDSTELKAGHAPAIKAGGVRHKEGKELVAPLKKNDHQKIDASSDTHYDDEDGQLQRQKCLRERELEAHAEAERRAVQLEQNRTPVLPQKHQVKDKIMQPRFENH